MATVQIDVCDVCEDPSRGTRPYRIESLGRKADALLCDEHGKPLEHLLGDPRELSPVEPPKPVKVAEPARKRAAAKRTTSARKRTSLGARTVSSIGEIEQLKNRG